MSGSFGPGYQPPPAKPNWVDVVIDYYNLVQNSNKTTKDKVTVSTSTTTAATVTSLDRAAMNDYEKNAQGIFSKASQKYTKAADKASDTASLKDDIAAAKVYLTSLENAIQENAKGISTANSVTWATTEAKTAALSTLITQQTKLNKEHARIQGVIDSLNDSLNTKVVAKGDKGTNITHDTKTVADTPSDFVKGIVAPPQLNPNTSPAGASLVSAPAPQVEEQTQVSTAGRPSKGLSLTYNVPTVSDAYFSNNTEYLKETTYRGNTPQKVERAMQLFNSASNSKGMFAMTNVTKNLSGIAPSGGDPGGGAGWSYEAEWVKWGFQFLYNPATVTMTYAMAPAIDLGMLTSGREGFNLMGTDGNFSTISFEIIINRMFDMKYFNKNGTLTEAGKAQYGNHVPTAKDQIDIFKKGTMYDIEYLLRTASQGALIQKSWLRGYTADLGYVGAAPVELHLGKSMRYWGMLAGMEVNHTIFNERMVPVFSSVSLTFSRYVEPSKAPK